MIEVTLDEALADFRKVSKYLSVTNALVNLSGRENRRFVSLTELHDVLPQLDTATIGAELGSLHDRGRATVIGQGLSRRARWDDAL